MNFTRLRMEVANHSMVPNRKTAGELIKAVLGHLLSRMSEDDARVLTKHFPEELSPEKLRGHQKHTADFSVPRFIEGISEQFYLSPEDARLIVDAIVMAVKNELSVEEEKVIERHLPHEWRLLVEQA